MLSLSLKNLSLACHYAEGQSRKRESPPRYLSPRKRKEKPAPGRLLNPVVSSQPLVTIGGGAFGDLPAQAAKLSNARVAMAATASFFMEAPGFDPPWQLWGILRH